MILHSFWMLFLSSWFYKLEQAAYYHARQKEVKILANCPVELPAFWVGQVAFGDIDLSRLFRGGGESHLLYLKQLCNFFFLFWLTNPGWMWTSLDHLKDNLYTKLKNWLLHGLLSRFSWVNYSFKFSKAKLSPYILLYDGIGHSKFK